MSPLELFDEIISFEVSKNNFIGKLNNSV